MKQHSVSVPHETPVSPRSSPTDSGNRRVRDSSNDGDNDDVDSQQDEEKPNYRLAM